jgi:outer membrane protein
MAFCLSTSVFALKIGKVDVRKIMTSIKQGKQTQKNLKKEFEAKQKLLKKDEEKLKKMRAAYEKQSLVMNDKAKAKKQMEMQKTFEIYRQKREKYQVEIDKKERKMKEPLLKRLKAIIDSVSKKEGLDMVFEVAASPVYVKSEVNISDKVIKAYDKKHK